MFNDMLEELDGATQDEEKVWTDYLNKEFMKGKRKILFSTFHVLSNELKNISCIVQNDIEYTTDEIEQFGKDIDTFIKKVEILKKEIIKFTTGE